jgi:hypothetical protein
MTIYQLTPDEDISQHGTVNIQEMNEKMRRCLNLVSGLFAAFEGQSKTFGGVMDEIFQTFLRTHKSIALLLKEAENDPGHLSDARSLVREQIEKIFVVALLLEDPPKWIRVYFQDDWRRLHKYEEMLLFKERENLPRFSASDAEATQRYEAWRQFIGVTDEEKELIEFRVHHSGEPAPTHLRGVNVPKFPTPGDVGKYISDAPTQEFLRRWHREYEFFCGFSHVGLDKMFAPVIDQSRQFNTGEKDIILDTEVRVTITHSYLAAASAAAISYKYAVERDPSLQNSIDAINSISNMWSELKEISLFAKVLWGMYVKDTLPHIF